MTGGSQAAGVSGRTPFLSGRIITGIFSRCDGTGQPVNPQSCGKSGKCLAKLQMPVNQSKSAKSYSEIGFGIWRKM